MKTKPMTQPIFNPGMIIYSEKSLKILLEKEINAQDLIVKHSYGEWGLHGSYHVAADMLGHANRAAIDAQQGGVVQSEYEFGNQRICLVTKGVGKRGVSTTILLSSEEMTMG
ncbi:MAG TPA: hypothetical protein ACFE0H_00080 [Elainellaceae cyanobacterium]